MPRSDAGHELALGERLAGAPAWEEPGGVGVGGCRHVRAVVDVLGQQLGNGRWQRRGFFAELDADELAGGDDVMDAKAADSGDAGCA